MRRHVGQLHEVAEVLDRAVAPPVVQVADERRAVVRGEDRVHPADLDVPLRVPRVLGELARRARLDDRRHIPRGKRTRSPSTVAPASRRRRSASGSPRNSRPTSWRIVSAFCSMSDRPSSSRTSNGASFRVRNGTCSAWLARRSRLARRPPAAAPRGDLVHLGVLPRAGRDGPSSSLGPLFAADPAGPAALSAAAAARPWPGSGSRRSCAGRPSPRRSAPGSAARRRSRSSRPAGRPPSISVRAAADSRAMSAPVPAAFPAERTWSRSQSGMSPRTIAWVVSIWLPKAPASRISSTAVDLELVHQQSDAGVQGRLAELDRAHVVLGDERCAAGRPSRRSGRS